MVEQAEVVRVLLATVQELRLLAELLTLVVVVVVVLLLLLELVVRAL
jgi:hypothetical protein